MRRLLSIGAVLTAVVAALVLSAASGSDGGGLKTYEIELDNAFGLTEGGDLKIGGVVAGETTEFRLTKSRPFRTIMTVEVNEPGFDSLRTDADCAVRAQSLIGEYFIDCDLGEAPERLPDGGRIPVEQTASTIPPDLINNVMRRPYRDRFRIILTELGTGLAGRPEELNEVIRRAHPALRELTETLAILREQNTTIRDFIRDADTVSAAVEPFKEDVARWARESSDTSAIQASRSEQLGRYWERLPDFLAELKPTLGQLERTADSQIPTLRSLERAAPELERFLVAAQPFARETRGSITALGEATRAGSRAIDESSDEIRELRGLARLAPRLGKPLRQFLQTLDDRARSTEDDPAAGEVAPPAPDKTAYVDGQGFTGMEAFWTYILFQTLAINSYDELGHLLRIVLIAGGPCAGYSASPTQAEIDQCASWLGPYQPGVAGQPDPTGEEATATASAAGSRQSAAGGRGGGSGSGEGSQPGAGDPEAPPLPGQRDLSEPQIGLPPDLRGLLDGLGNGAPRPTPPALPGGDGAGSGADPADVLDYLLGP